MIGSRAGWPAAVLAVVGSTSCATLPDVQQGICGNGVIEPESGEDCDDQDTTTCGKPRSAAECRYVCDPQNGVECPDGGWKCGLDKICRLPSLPLSWSTSLDVPGLGASELLAADLDGDGITDAVSVAPPVIDVTYFEAARTATPGDQVLAQSPHPAVGVLGTGELPTMALTLSRGLGAFTATPDRTLFPATYASISSPIVGVRLQPFRDYEPSTPELPTPVTGFFAYNDTGVLAFRNSITLKDMVPFGAGQKRVGDGVVARFDGGRLCDQIAVGSNDATKGGHALVYSACDALGPQKAAAIADVSLPPPGPGQQPLDMCDQCQPIHVLDVDGDERADLVFVGSNNKAYIAYGDGLGHFASAPGGMATDVTSDGFGIPTPSKPAPPLAIADLNGDCALDFVLPSGIWLSTGLEPGSCAAGAKVPKSYYSASAMEDPHDWAEARIADMNRDGRPDVVVSSGAKPGITVYLGTGTLLLNPFEIVTDSPAKALAVGDFDGDLVDDIAFAESAEADSDGTAGGDTVYVAFGSPGGTPTFAQPIGDVGVVNQILPTFQLAIYPDLITDIFVLAQNKPGGPSGVSMYLFPGNSSRQINAPYFLLDVASQVLEVPRRALIGTFSNEPDRRDIAVFARSNTGSARLWLAPTFEDAYIVPVGGLQSGAPQATELPSALRAADDVLLADLGPRQGSSVDELVIAAPPLVSSVSGGSTLLTTTRVAGGAFEAPPDPVELPGFDITDGNVIVGQMITARFFQKDHPDVVLSSPRGGLAVVPWDDATGALDVEGVEWIDPKTLDDLECVRYSVAPKGRPTAGVAALAPDATGRQTLVVVRPGGAYLASWDGAQLVIECGLIDGGDAVATGDFNGDGIEDIVVSQRTGLTVYYGDALPAGWAGEEYVTVSEVVQ